MPDPDPPLHPSCWAWTRGEWRKGRIWSKEPIPGALMGPGWDPGRGYLMVSTPGFYEPLPEHHVVRPDSEGVRGPQPTEPPEDWEPDGGPGFLG